MAAAVAMGRLRWLAPLVAGVIVAAVQLGLVAAAGTDVPFFDQWDAEGRGLYPAFVDGTLGVQALVAPHNEHRILVTRLLDLGLFAANGQWDPLVQLAANAVLHGLLAALLVAVLARGWGARPTLALAAGVVVLNLPVLGWHNALWGFQSQVYLCLLLSVGALALLAPREASLPRRLAGGGLAGAAMLAMGGGLLVPAAVAAAWLLRRERTGRAWAIVAATGLLAWALHVAAPEHAALRAHAAPEFLAALRRVLAWPDREGTWLSLVANLPLALYALARLAGRVARPAGEDVLLALAAWAVLVAGAMAWSRGGGTEFAAGVPSRYADFLALLPLANLWCVVALAPRVAVPWRIAAGAWVALAALTWSAAAQPEWRGVIAPRARDRAAPERLARAFQLSGDPAVYRGQPRLYLVHPTPAVATAVLADPRLQGRLPPTFQPERPAGPLSRAVRWLLGR